MPSEWNAHADPYILFPYARIRSASIRSARIRFKLVEQGAHGYVKRNAYNRHGGESVQNQVKVADRQAGQYYPLKAANGYRCFGSSRFHHFLLNSLNVLILGN